MPDGANIDNPRAVIGGNNPPPSLLEAAATAVDLAETEARNWLDGAPVETEEDAEAITQIMEMARDARKLTDGNRKEEAKPFDEGKKRVHAEYKPLLTKCDTIIDAVKGALAPYLAAKEKARQDAERKAREEADRKAQEALKAQQEAKSLADREAAAQAAESARIAEATANKIGRSSGGVKGEGTRRAVSLTTTTHAVVTDYSAALRWIFQNDRAACERFADDYAASHKTAKIDGVTIETRETVR